MHVCMRACMRVCGVLLLSILSVAALAIPELLVVRDDTSRGTYKLLVSTVA